MLAQKLFSLILVHQLPVDLQVGDWSLIVLIDIEMKLVDGVVGSFGW